MLKSTFSSYLMPVIIVSVVAFITYSAYQKTNEQDVISDDNTAASMSEPQIPAGLLQCNQVESAQLNEAFSTCLDFAEQGFIDAQRKVAWAYTRDGNEQDWQKAFIWLKKVAMQDTDIELLSHIVLFLLGESEQDKIDAEINIRHLADVRFSPAEAYLATLYLLELNKLPRDANPVWLLRKAYDQDKSIISPFEMATVYANGFGTRKNTDKAKQVLVDYVERDFPVAANNVAWFLATLDSNTITSTEFVVDLAESALDSPENANRYSFVDTLAASYAVIGDFEKAITTQQKAIELITALDENDAAQIQEKAEFEARLELYRNGERAILDSINVEQTAFFTALKRDIEEVLLSSLNVFIKPSSAVSDIVSGENTVPEADLTE